MQWTDTDRKWDKIFTDYSTYQERYKCLPLVMARQTLIVYIAQLPATDLTDSGMSIHLYIFIFIYDECFVVGNCVQFISSHNTSAIIHEANAYIVYRNTNKGGKFA